MTGEQRPWIGGDLVIEESVLDAIYEDAKACYPSEACGFVMGPADDPRRLDATVREDNEADKYHALDPDTFPRTSATYFKINELRAARAFEKGDAEGRPLKVIYHSHVDTGAYFSAEDAATFSNEGQLMWPCAFIVVSVHGKDGPAEVKDVKLWVHRPGTDEFDESTLKVV
jgi:proteasome lid subunit RPN8/RPN11